MIIERRMTGLMVPGFGGVVAPNRTSLFGPSVIPVAKDNLKIYTDAASPYSYPSSGTTWTDLSGNGINASGNTTPTYGYEFGGVFEWNLAFTFFWNFGNPTELEPTANSFTFFMWAYAISGTTFEHRLIRKGTFGDTRVVGISKSSNSWFFVCGSSSFVSASLPQNTWIMLGISRDASTKTAYAYYNGNIIGSGNTSSLTSTTDPWTIGTANTFTTATGWYGKVGLFSFYNSVLSGNDAQEWYQLSRRRYGV